MNILDISIKATLKWNTSWFTVTKDLISDGSFVTLSLYSYHCGRLNLSLGSLKTFTEDFSSPFMMIFHILRFRLAQESSN